MMALRKIVTFYYYLAIIIIIIIISIFFIFLSLLLSLLLLLISFLFLFFDHSNYYWSHYYYFHYFCDRHSQVQPHPDNATISEREIRKDRDRDRDRDYPGRSPIIEKLEALGEREKGSFLFASFYFLLINVTQFLDIYKFIS